MYNVRIKRSKRIKSLPGISLDPRGLLDAGRLFSRSTLADFSLLGDFLALNFPERSKCSDLDFGIPEEIQSANKFSSSSFVLFKESIDKELKEELKDLFGFESLGLSGTPVELPELALRPTVRGRGRWDWKLVDEATPQEKVPSLPPLLGWGGAGPRIFDLESLVRVYFQLLNLREFYTKLTSPAIKETNNLSWTKLKLDSDLFVNSDLHTPVSWGSHSCWTQQGCPRWRSEGVSHPPGGNLLRAPQMQDVNVDRSLWRIKF